MRQDKGPNNHRDKSRDEPKAALIKTNLKKAFDEKAGEDLPADLMALIAQLRDQDGQNGK